MRKEGNIDYQVDSNSVSVTAKTAVSPAMVSEVDVLEWKRYDRKKEVDRVEFVGEKGILIYPWYVIQAVRREVHV